MKRVTMMWLACCLLSARAQAGDLQGTWVVDLAASDSLDPLLKAQGVSWVKRKAADGLQVTQTITRDGDQLSVKVVSAAMTKEETLLVDGETRTIEGERGPVQVRHTWEGDTLVTVQQGAGGALTTRRDASDDGSTLTQTLTVQSKDGETLVVKRIFRKP